MGPQLELDPRRQPEPSQDRGLDLATERVSQLSAPERDEVMRREAEKRLLDTNLGGALDRIADTVERYLPQADGAEAQVHRTGAVNVATHATALADQAAHQVRGDTPELAGTVEQAQLVEKVRELAAQQATGAAAREEQRMQEAAQGTRPEQQDQSAVPQTDPHHNREIEPHHAAEGPPGAQSDTKTVGEVREHEPASRAAANEDLLAGPSEEPSLHQSHRSNHHTQNGERADLREQHQQGGPDTQLERHPHQAEREHHPRSQQHQGSPQEHEPTTRPETHSDLVAERLAALFSMPVSSASTSAQPIPAIQQERPEASQAPSAAIDNRLRFTHAPPGHTVRVTNVA